MSDDAQTLINAIGDWKLRLETRDMMEPKRTVDNQGIVRTEMEFKTQLLQFPRAVVEETVQAVPKPVKCTLLDVTILSNATIGVDFGVGTSRPLPMTTPYFRLAIDQMGRKPSFVPLSVHSGSLIVTPPCTPTGLITANISTGIYSAVAQRTALTCFAVTSLVAASGSQAGAVFDEGCPDDGIQTRDYSYGASGVVSETINLGDVAIAEATLDDASVVWVAYDFFASASWACSLGPCSDGSGGSSNSSGDVCNNFLALYDPFGAPPAGTTSSANVACSGSGWTVGTTGAGLAVAFQNPALLMGCEQVFTAGY